MLAGPGFEVRNSKSGTRNRRLRFWGRLPNFHFRLSSFVTLAVTVAALLLARPAFAQGCAMCYTTAAAAKATAIRALRSGILILLIPPLLMATGIFVRALRSRERFSDEIPEGSGPDRELKEWWEGMPAESGPDLVGTARLEAQAGRALRGEMIQTQYNRWLHRYATFLVGATFLLIIAGALVTSNDAGLSVPDWPTSFGSFRMPRMAGGVLYEHGHRMIAGTVALLTLVLALWLWRSEPRAWVRKLGGIAVLAILAQAVLGGLTVLFFLPAAISVSHATLAQLFFCLTISLALFTRADWCGPERPWDDAKSEDSSLPALRRLAWATTFLILLQLILGAAFRHNGFGIIPHLLGAVLVTIGVLWVAARVLALSPRQPRLTRAVLWLGGLLLVQVLLGVGSYFMKLAARDAPQPLPPVVIVTTAHVAAGALVLAASLIVTLEVYRTVRAARRASPARHALAPEKV